RTLRSAEAPGPALGDGLRSLAGTLSLLLLTAAVFYCFGTTHFAAVARMYESVGFQGRTLWGVPPVPALSLMLFLALVLKLACFPARRALVRHSRVDGERAHCFYLLTAWPAGVVLLARMAPLVQSFLPLAHALALAGAIGALVTGVGAARRW